MNLTLILTYKLDNVFMVKDIENNLNIFREEFSILQLKQLILFSPLAYAHISKEHDLNVLCH